MSVLSCYTETIKILQAGAVEFTVTGTFALYLQKNSFSDNYTIKDCDIFIEYNQENISSFVQLMQASHWTIRVWEEAVDLTKIMEQTKGKFYLRCTKNNLILDATYEHEAAIFGDPEIDRCYADSIPVIAAEKIIEGKKYRGTERDKLAVTLFEKL